MFAGETGRYCIFLKNIELLEELLSLELPSSSLPASPSLTFITASHSRSYYRLYFLFPLISFPKLTVGGYLKVLPVGLNLLFSLTLPPFSRACHFF